LLATFSPVASKLAPTMRTMAAAKPATIDAYIRAAPPAGRAHLERIREILREVAPDAQEAIKWGQPFFIEPRFLFSFNANKAHLNFAPSASTLAAFAKELDGHRTTKNFLQVGYDEPLPEALIRKLAKHQLRAVRARKDDAFW
jgi:uncharacterized protein YdhG (YjbR/CyaY superfamily)